MHIIFVIGPPASGKTTLAMSLARENGYEYCNPSDWLRITRDRPSDLGHYITSNYTFECLDPLVSQWVSLRVNEAILLGNTIVVDGYPRTDFQVKKLSTTCANQRFYVVNLTNVSIDESVRRTLRRPWSPPHGSIDDNNSGEYRPVTLRDAQRRYRIYNLTPPEYSISIDASVWTPLVLSQTKHRLETLPSMLIALPKEPNSFMIAATALESAEVIQRSQTLVGTSRKFVGSHPISLQRLHLPLLYQSDYLVSIKWDGERSLMLIFAGHVWLIMRNFVVLKSRWAAELAADEWDDSLLDIEWFSHEKEICVLDALRVSTLYIGNQPLLKRLHCVKKLLPLVQDVCQLCKCRMQRYYAMADFRFCTINNNNNNSNIKHDGFIFTHATRPYHIGRDENMFKFKNAADNTVDLMIYGGCDLYARSDTDDDNGKIKVGVLVSADHSYPDGAVLECLPVSRAFRTWKIVKHRVDRSEGNAHWVVGRILDSIADDIHLDELINMPGVR